MVGVTQILDSITSRSNIICINLNNCTGTELETASYPKFRGVRFGSRAKERR